MKQLAFNHPKIMRLAVELEIDMAYARGIMESLWVLTAINFPQGDIGRWSNTLIATGIGYQGNPDVLIEMLLRCELLVWVANDARLIVHDWHEHADDWVQSRLARKGKSFASGQTPRSSRLSQRERSRLQTT